MGECGLDRHEVNQPLAGVSPTPSVVCAGSTAKLPTLPQRAARWNGSSTTAIGERGDPARPRAGDKAEIEKVPLDSMTSSARSLRWCSVS